jgi:chitodextrinase
MTRSEAKAFINAVVKLRGLATDEQALEVLAIYPAWREEVEYAVGDRVLYNDVLYRVLQTHTSQATWTPDISANLFAKVLIPDVNVIPEWEQPDSTNPYMIGDKVKHNGKTWVSIVDNNVWEPGIYGWEEA